MLFVPAPYEGKVFHHVYPLGTHLGHPRVLEHLPRAGSAIGLLLQTVNRTSISIKFQMSVIGSATYQHSIKYLKLSLQYTSLAGSSLRVGTGCLTM